MVDRLASRDVASALAGEEVEAVHVESATGAVLCGCTLQEAAHPIGKVPVLDDEATADAVASCHEHLPS